jgi:hypothetical protein
MLAHERLELRNDVDVAVELEVGFEATLERAQAELIKAVDVRRGEGRGGEVGERLAAPEAERLAQQ